MKGSEYIYKLDKRLRNIPKEEREDAIAYYSEFFQDAGEEEIEEIVARIGSPSRVAAGIRADIAARELEGEPKVKKGVYAAWLAVLGVFALPIALPLGISGIVVVFALLISIAAVYISLAISAIGFVIAGITSTIVGLIIIPQGLSTAAFYVGSGLSTAALGLLLGVAVYLLTKVTLRGVANLFNKIRYRKINKINKQNKKNERMAENEQSM